MANQGNQGNRGGNQDNPGSGQGFGNERDRQQGGGMREPDRNTPGGERHGSQGDQSDRNRGGNTGSGTGTGAGQQGDRNRQGNKQTEDEEE